MQQKPSISIAMCLYNPNQRHLNEQMKSILSQSLLPDEVVVCDDSKESMKDYFQDWGESSDIAVKYTKNKIPLGIVSNFSSAVSMTEGEYILLCDQDDVWESEKIQNSIAAIQEKEGEAQIPTLFHSDLSLINDASQKIGTSFMKKQRIQGGKSGLLGMLMLHNVVTGCATAMNRSLVEKAMPIPQGAVVHDWWLALVAACHGQIVFNKKPLVQYRLHDANSIGLRPLLSFGNIKRLVRVNHIGEEFAKVARQNLAFQEQHGDIVSKEMNLFFDSLSKGGIPLVKAAANAGVKPQALSRSVRFWVAAISKTYKKHLSAHIG